LRGKKSFKQLQKAGSVRAEVTSYDRVFHSWPLATGKTWSPIVTSRLGLYCISTALLYNTGVL